MELTTLLTQYSLRVQTTLEQILPAKNEQPSQLHQAMRYMALSPAKHFRPTLVYLTGQAFGASLATLDFPACAIELMHCYSLVHDDLPAMDNDDMRRGQATCHIAFDEATAILVGDALQTLAFELLANSRHRGIDSTHCLMMIEILAKASGSLGMGGGQMLDLESSGQSLSLEKLETIYRLKTAALMSASVQIGAIAAGHIDSETLLILDKYASLLGLAFQIQDDVLELELSLQAPKNEISAKTITHFLSLEDAKNYVVLLLNQAKEILLPLGKKAEYLQALVDIIKIRKH